MAGLSQLGAPKAGCAAARAAGPGVALIEGPEHVIRTLRFPKSIQKKPWMSSEDTGFGGSEEHDNKNHGP